MDTDGANYQLEMMRCLREVNIDNNTVGWYSTFCPFSRAQSGIGFKPGRYIWMSQMVVLCFQLNSFLFNLLVNGSGYRMNCHA